VPSLNAEAITHFFPSLFLCLRDRFPLRPISSSTTFFCFPSFCLRRDFSRTSKMVPRFDMCFLPAGIYRRRINSMRAKRDYVREMVWDSFLTWNYPPLHPDRQMSPLLSRGHKEVLEDECPSFWKTKPMLPSLSPSGMFSCSFVDAATPSRIPPPRKAS